MASLEKDLSEEISRILSCPYPASLAKLADILAQCNPQTIRKCIHDVAPCAIQRLAKIVESALPLWANSLHILRALCESELFIQQLLLQNPLLLDALLTKATSSQQDFEKYAGLCVLLLSYPLPEALTLPASAQLFFLRVFEDATQSPDIAALRPTYAMLDGACRGIMNTLSPQIRHSFDRELCKILQSKYSAQNSILLLWCFGVIILVEFPDEVGRKFTLPSNPSDRVSPDRKCKTVAGQKVFGSTGSLHKTINLIYLSVVSASMSAVGVSDNEAIEVIKIASRTMQLIDRELREAWPNSSTLAQQTFRRLPDKILQQGIDSGVQLQAMCFYALIAGENNLLDSIVEQYEAALLNITALQGGKSSVRELLTTSLPIFASHLHESTIHRTLSHLLRLSQSTTSLYMLCKLSILVEELTAVVAAGPHFRSRILAATSSNELQESIWTFLKSPRGASKEPTGLLLCDAATTAMRQSLQSSIVSFFLTAALTETLPDTKLAPDLAMSLLHKQQQLCKANEQCTHTVPKAQQTLSIFEQGCTPSTGKHEMDWKERLKSELEMQSSYQRDSLIRSVTQICHDLESRCANVEEPLRQEQARVQDLTHQVSRFAEQIESLESVAVDRRLYIDGLEAENGVIQHEKDTLSSDLDDLHIKLAEANRVADVTLRAAQKDFEAKALQARSIILSHEEDLHARTLKIDGLAKDVEQLEQSNEALNTEKESLDDLVNNLEAKRSILEDDLVTERDTVANQAQVIARLEDIGRDLETRLLDKINELKIVHDQWDDLQTKHQELTTSSEQALQNMQVKHEASMEAVAAKANDDRDRLHNELQNAVQIGVKARNEYEQKQKEYQLAQTTINTLQVKVQQLTYTCSEKEQELHELKALRSKMLDAMGVAAENPLPLRSSRRSNNKSVDFKAPQRRRHKSIIQAEEDMISKAIGRQELSSTEMENVANASFVSTDSFRDGSTPKRARTGTALNNPAMHTVRGQKSDSAHKILPPGMISPTKRPALGDMSPNRRHTTVGFVISENEEFEDLDDGKRRGSLHDLGPASFDMEGLLTSTPGMIYDREPTEGEEETLEL